MEKITQKNRQLGISTPMGDDYFLLERMKVREGISELFEIDVVMFHEEKVSDLKFNVLKPEDVLGKTVTILIDQQDEGSCYYSGIISHFSHRGRSVLHSVYHAKIVPQLWKATKNSQSRIFQHMTVPDILLQVLADYHVVDKIDKTDFKEREYCVQYRESDFNFVSRLMEEEGIYYYFEHADGLDKLVLTNVPSGHIDCPKKSEIPIINEKVGSESWVSSVSEWQMDYELQSGKVTLWDHHAQIPTQNHEHVELSIFNAGNNQEMEIYDFPGGYTRKYDEVDKTGGQTSNLQNIPADKQRTAKTLIQALDAEVSTVTAFSDCCTITSGHKFKLIQHPIKELNRQYLVISAEHDIVQNPGYPGMSDDESEGLVVNNFKCIPFGEKAPIYRPKRRTPQSIVQGTQTATVVGPSGQEIFTDKYGRVKIKFHWDQAQDNNDNTAWVRVGRDIAGNKWGTMYIPRIGQEVIVDFLHGDPDQPIIVGSVYNQQNMPHYELPKFKTLTYIKTKTSPDDGKGYNELRFEDKANKEQVFVRSQKRYDLRVRGSMYETCGGNRQEVIGFKQENQPGGNLAVTVAGNYDLHVQTDQFITVDGKLNEGIKGDVIENYGANLKTFVKTNVALNASEIAIEAASKISLTVGGNTVTIDASGVTVIGTMVKINSGGSGTETGDAGVDDALDAEVSDNGEPGNLDRPRTGGGGGRKHHTLNSQHYVYPPRPGESAAFTAMRNKLNTSAQGRHALDVFERNNVAVTTNPGGTAYSPNPTNSVNLDPTRTDSQAAGFVHEMGHTEADHGGTSANVQTQTRAAYVDTQLREDANNERRAYEAEDQMNAAGGTEQYNSSTRSHYTAARDAEKARLQAAEPGISQEELNRRSNDAGEAAILQDYRNGNVNTGNTNPPQSYVNYWGSDYDNRHGAASPGPTPDPD